MPHGPTPGSDHTGWPDSSTASWTLMFWFGMVPSVTFSFEWTRPSRIGDLARHLLHTLASVGRCCRGRKRIPPCHLYRRCDVSRRRAHVGGMASRRRAGGSPCRPCSARGSFAAPVGSTCVGGLIHASDAGWRSHGERRNSTVAGKVPATVVRSSASRLGAGLVLRRRRSRPRRLRNVGDESLGGENHRSD